MIDEIKQLNPKYWGKSSWIFLNSLGLTYSPEKKSNYKIFFSNIGDILPCGLCSSHYNTFLPKLDEALESKQTLLDWLLEIRNDINLKTNKPILGLNDIIGEIYFTNSNQSTHLTQSNQLTQSTKPIKIFNWFNTIIKKIKTQYIPNQKNILVVIIIILIIYFYKKYNNKKRNKKKKIINIKY